MSKDVHTEHCCNRHGCKYAQKCPVESGEKPQSYMCEMCEDEFDVIWEMAHLMNEMYEKGRLAEANERDMLKLMG